MILPVVSLTLIYDLQPSIWFYLSSKDTEKMKGQNVQDGDETGYNVWYRNIGFEKKGRWIAGKDMDENDLVDSQIYGGGSSLLRSCHKISNKLSISSCVQHVPAGLYHCWRG